MGAFGERLRRQRELRGVSLEEISQSTKIGTRLLRALEDEQFERLPGGIFNKGFIRAYARYLGIDEDAAVAEYLEVAGHDGPDVRVIAEQSSPERFRRNDRDVVPAVGGGSSPLVSLLVIVVVIIGAASGWQVYKERQRTRWQQAATSRVSASSAPALASQPAATQKNGSNQGSSGLRPANEAQGKAIATNPSTEISELQPVERSESRQPTKPAPNGAIASPRPAQPSATQDQAAVPSAQDNTLIAAANPVDSGGTPFEVIVRAKDRAWVSIKSDGKLMVRGVIKPPDIKTIRATDEVVLWTGNAGDVEVSFNGKDVPLAGGQNDERLLVFNANGLLSRTAEQ